MANIRGVILDVDGTLVDSNDAHARAWVEALAEHGRRVSLVDVRRLIGMGGDKLLPRVSGLTEDSPEGQAVSRRRGEIFRERYLPSLRPTRGARELLLHLARKGLKLVVASSAKRKELHSLLEICGADDLVANRTSSDDADNSKPDPDIVQAALASAGLAPAQVVLLGDTPYDIEAAGRARVCTIALRCGGWADADLAGAAAVYEDPADLLAHYGSSPLGAAAGP